MEGALNVANFFLTEHVRLSGVSAEAAGLERLHEASE